MCLNVHLPELTLQMTNHDLQGFKIVAGEIPDECPLSTDGRRDLETGVTFAELDSIRARIGTWPLSLGLSCAGSVRVRESKDGAGVHLT